MEGFFFLNSHFHRATRLTVIDDFLYKKVIDDIHFWISSFDHTCFLMITQYFTILFKTVQTDSYVNFDEYKPVYISVI